MVFIDTQAACQPPEVRPATLAQRDKIEECAQGRGDECGEDTQFQSLHGNQKLILLDGERMVGKASHDRRVKFKRLATRRRARSHVDRFRRSEEHTSELQSLMRISYAVFCLKKKQN